MHVYPDGDPHRPGATRIASLGQSLFTACTSSKPCGLTEWGFGNADQACPLNDETRMQLVQDMRSAFKHFVDQGRLGAIVYYDWLGTTGGKQFFAVFRCGALTPAGKLALSPM